MLWKRVRGSMLGRFTQPFCETSHDVVHEGELQAETRVGLRAALPWAVRENPGR